MRADRRILVLGVGNVLLRDEGAGVHAVNRLAALYSFPDNVRLMDGGTLGMRLLGPIGEADVVIVIDAVRAGRPPGAIHRLTGTQLAGLSSSPDSTHQVGLAHTLAAARLLGSAPELVVMGVEPQDMGPGGTALSDVVRGSMDTLLQHVLEEVRAAGGRFEARAPDQPATAGPWRPAVPEEEEGCDRSVDHRVKYGQDL